MWEFLTALVEAMTVPERILYIIIIVYGIYKGIVVVPWIKWPNKNRQKTSHKNCELYPDLQNVLRALPDLYSLPYKTIEDQMNIAEDVQQDIQDLMWRHYLKLYKKKNNNVTEGITSEVEVKAYDYILRYALDRAKDKIRTYFRENHFAELSEAEFINKSEVRVDQIVRLVSAILNDVYPSKATVSREELYDWNMSEIGEVKLKLLNLLRQARSISIAYKEKRKKLEEELEKIVA